MNAFVELKSEIDDFEVEFDVFPPIDLSSISDERQQHIQEEINNLDVLLEDNWRKIDEINANIDRLTNHADGIDYALSVTCGIITGLIDVFIVGEWDFKNAKEISNKEINKKAMDFAQKDPEYAEFLNNKKTNQDPNRLDNAIEFLEKKYKLPGDGAYKKFKDLGVTDSTHHLDDFCHHPTFIGLICCIIVQFTGSATYRTSSGGIIKTHIEINQYGKFASEEKWGKVFAGVINWFFNVGKIMRNRTGHLISDMAGSSTSAGKGNEGSGLPGSFLSLAKEISSLPCFMDSNFSENLRKAYQNGIGTGKKQVDLGPFNSLFEGASSKLDMRTEMAITHELKRQSVPVILNEVLVRGIYFIRHFVSEMKEKQSILEINWNNVMPFRNRTIVRMLTIASGTFTAVDMADAAIRSAVKSKGVPQAFFANMVLRVNFVGVGRFALAVGTDCAMGISREISRNKRIKIYEEQLALTDAKLFYKQASMWIQAEDTEKTIEEAYATAERCTIFFCESMQEISDNLKLISEYIPSIEDKNPNLLNEIDDILTWG